MPSSGKLEIVEDYDQSTLQIDICDEGKDMIQEQMNPLGDPYFTTKETGTGHGMMVSFSIIKGMNGRVKVTSEKGLVSPLDSH